jgi:hypothetical protein
MSFVIGELYMLKTFAGAVVLLLASRSVFGQSLATYEIHEAGYGYYSGAPLTTQVYEALVVDRAASTIWTCEVWVVLQRNGTTTVSQRECSVHTATPQPPALTNVTVAEKSVLSNPTGGPPSADFLWLINRTTGDVTFCLEASSVGCISLSRPSR